MRPLMIQHKLLPRGPRKVHEPIYIYIITRGKDLGGSFHKNMSCSHGALFTPEMPANWSNEVGLVDVEGTSPHRLG